MSNMVAIVDTAYSILATTGMIASSVGIVLAMELSGMIALSVGIVSVVELSVELSVGQNSGVGTLQRDQSS